MTVDELVGRFVEIGFAQDEALLRDETARFNRLFDEKTVILNELKARPGDARGALVKLYRHANLQVALNAAKATLAVAPEAARQAIEAISASRRFPQAGDAGMCLWALDEGIFRPG